MLKIILASSSPRRTELLKQVGLDFEIIPANIKEEFEDYMGAGQYVSEMSKQKAMTVAKKVKENTTRTHMFWVPIQLW